MGDRLVTELERDGRKVQLFAADHVPEIYIDGIHGVLFTGGNVKLNLYSAVPDPGIEAERRELVCRLTLSAASLLQIRDFMDRVVLPRLVEQGVIVPTSPAAEGMTEPPAGGPPPADPPVAPPKKGRRPTRKAR